ncbi:MAG: 16S rRNA (uracil(1498)-N(3))-methyltransferase [Endomicrobium sp.]|jgi:16S rRNA (uracil1498-N3)-methyltransferase|nr:16S rRNA (uracil(1498)-N(3))-methyltransferase [Endomicrobium sp.]
MPHFYVKPDDIKGQSFSISGEQAHYLVNVRRFKTDDKIMIFDGLGNSYKAQVTSINKNEILGKIIYSSYKIPKFKIHLYTAIPKGDRFEWMIEKCAEIGVFEITPISTKRSMTTSFSKNKSERYKKISISASSQCIRSDIMKINEPLDFKRACKDAIVNKTLINILPWESENHILLRELFKSSSYGGANIFIGPEGGFENGKIEFARSLGIHTISLGENILRVETAAIVASALVLNRV